MSYYVSLKSKEPTKEIAYHWLPKFHKLFFHCQNENFKKILFSTWMPNLKRYYRNHPLNKKLISMFKWLFDDLGCLNIAHDFCMWPMLLTCKLQWFLKKNFKLWTQVY
jgi:hypothetical protein